MTMPTQKHPPSFELIEFNHVRYGRGKDAAKIRVTLDGENQGFLWMSAEDLRLNIGEFGASEALEKALRLYGETV